ncbi:D-amino-acid oxidase [Mycena alexandri]|uniref:D-amino-acid oxidase n=1 Tax=Mycena alexandri TaxID=1745969 RepID=A0AAD6STK0_9AGAR|nr:D-amino-acid oxidase [Mycena alexandri]
MHENLDVFVIGAGVVGLSTAIRALEAGFNVTIFAETFPTDPKSISCASFWAGANHISVATTNALLHRLEADTLSIFLKLIKDQPLVPVMIRLHKEHAEVSGPAYQQQSDHVAHCYSDFRALDSSELPEGVVCGGTFSTIFIDVPKYLLYLMDRFLSSGGRAFRVKLPSVSALVTEKDRPSLAAFPATSTNVSPSFDPAAVINCTGLGAVSLGDVLDTNLYPTRGEILILHAPWINHGLTHHWEDGHITYVIPRQSDGRVILGGTFQPDDWYPTSRAETVKLIKERGIHAYPELLPPGRRENRDINDLEVIEECVGLRPTRKGGVRLEVSSLTVANKSYPIVHNYGHGGAGYQSSWGSAKFAVDLLKSVVKNDD